jgi:hypothetical protein
LERAANGHAGNVGIAVRASESAPVDKLCASRPHAGNGYAVKAARAALTEAIANGSLHPSLVEQPRAACRPRFTLIG